MIVISIISSKQGESRPVIQRHSLIQDCDFNDYKVGTWYELDTSSDNGDIPLKDFHRIIMLCLMIKHRT